MTKHIIEFTENEIFCFEVLKKIRKKHDYMVKQNKDFCRYIFEGKSLIFDLTNSCPSPDFAMENIYYGNLSNPLALIEEESPDLFEKIINYLKGVNCDR